MPAKCAATAAALTLSLGCLAPGPHVGLRLQRLCRGWKQMVALSSSGGCTCQCATQCNLQQTERIAASRVRCAVQGCLTVLGLFGEVGGRLLHHLLGACSDGARAQREEAQPVSTRQ